MYMCGEAGIGKCNVDIKDNFQELSFFFHSRFGDLSQASRHLQHIFLNVDTAHYFVQELSDPLQIWSSYLLWYMWHWRHIFPS